MDVKNKFNAFLNILDAIPVSVYWKDRSGRYLGCNKYMLDMAGLTREDIIGKTDKDLVWKDIAEELHQIDSFVIQSRTKHEIEESPLIVGSQKRTYLSTKTPLYDEAGNEIIGIIGVSVDITDRKDAEKLQKEKNEQVFRAIKMLSGSVAHEMRTPLAGIAINVDNLQMKLKDLLVGCSKEKEEKEIAGFIQNIKFAIHSVNNIISMLLVKLRSIIDHRSSDMMGVEKFRSTSIKSDISNALKEYHFYGKENEIVVWDDKKNKDFKYMGDPLLTKHIIFNLVKNSLKAIKEVDRGKIYINLCSDKKFNYLTFMDTASGISSQALTSLFQQFSGSSRDGAGLGLLFCKTTMQSYGGDITCDSKEGEYTKFTLSFPVMAT